MAVQKMRSYEEALEIINRLPVSLTAEMVDLTACLGRVLAKNVLSDTDMPPFNKSAMDGYACRFSDLSGILKIVEELPAGKKPQKKIGPGQCARIMTGGMIPEGADFVLMKEHAVIQGDLVRCVVEPGSSNICCQGEDVREGDVVVPAGAKLLPAHVAMLAATGCIMPEVYKTPEVAIISTGTELTEPDVKPGSGRIRNSNGYQILAQCIQYGAITSYLGIVEDEKDKISHIISSALESFKVILVSGGVSVGDYDYIPDVLKELGAETLFHGLNMKPGKHFLLARKEDRYIACLPGNPVSSYVIFEVFVRPLLNRLTGCIEPLRRMLMPLESSYKRKKSDSLFFIPVRITWQGTALPLEYHGSAHIQAYTMADGIMEVPEGISEYYKGQLVYVRPV
ncbi:MAG TPA: gephyrin-like molybdotransferase Glp [Bacteroidales bacterium]|nr:gephyrin-like molybdotransferase Glp [Bacteroidales bacterium]